jgi:hypothetical protein
MAAIMGELATMRQIKTQPPLTTHAGLQGGHTRSAHDWGGPAAAKRSFRSYLDQPSNEPAAGVKQQLDPLVQQKTG